MVKALDTIIIHRAMVGSGGLVEVAGVVVAHCDPVPIDIDISGPAQGVQGSRGMTDQPELVWAPTCESDTKLCAQNIPPARSQTFICLNYNKSQLSLQAYWNIKLASILEYDRAE